MLYYDILSEPLRPNTDLEKTNLKAKVFLSCFICISEVVKTLAILNLFLLLLENKYQIFMTEGKSIKHLQENLKKKKALSPFHSPHFYEAGLCASLEFEHIVGLTGHLFFL